MGDPVVREKAEAPIRSRVAPPVPAEPVTLARAPSGSESSSPPYAWRIAKLLSFSWISRGSYQDCAIRDLAVLLFCIGRRRSPDSPFAGQPTAELDSGQG